LWQEEEFKQICSRESLTEKAANIEKTIVVKEHERARYDFDPPMLAGRRGAVVEYDFYNKLEKLKVQAGKKDKILLAQVQCICEAHTTVMRSYYQQIQFFIICKRTNNANNATH